MTYIYYTLIPLLIVLTAIVLLRKRGMKSNIVRLLDDSQFNIWENEQEGVNNPYLFPQENNRSSTEERN